ncbi:MAG TPA: hypothetical protein DDZ40_09560 [Deltaproteobacteria bacterium]|nr:hypothetical protein [Deltaproteobacteria bacterium]
MDTSGPNQELLEEISALKLHIRDLQESELDREQRLLNVTNNLSNAVVYQITGLPDGSRCFTYVSRSVERLNEVTVEEVMADAGVIYRQVLPEYRSIVTEHEEEALKNLTTLRVEVLSRLPSGCFRWFEYTSTPRRQTDGLLVWDGVEVDITDRKRMEEELRMHRDHLGTLVAERTDQIRQEVVRRKEKEEQYLALVESIRGWVWEANADLVHTYASSGMQEILGYGLEEFIGKSPVDFMPAGEIERLKPLIKKTISQKHPFISLHHTALHKKGHPIFVEVNGVPFFDQKGKLLGYRGSCHDITEQKRTMDALKEREEELTVKSKTLEEVNAALRVLLKQREEDREDLEQQFVSNIREMILPYILKAKKGQPDPAHKTYLEIAVTNLNEIISPFLNTMRQLNFTPREIEVASLVKDGRTTKEIAELMGVAPSAIDSHRNNIRIKVGLNKKKINLRSYLLSLK